MEKLEEDFRTTDSTNRKYLKRLTNYIEELIERGRYIEAKHFFEKLKSVSPQHTKTIRLGYTIAIAVFDNDSVPIYDRLLFESGADGKEILWYRLRYYQSRNNISQCELVSCELLDSPISTEYFSTIFEVCIERQNYIIAEALARHASKYRLPLSIEANKWFKKIVLTKLINTIPRH